MLRCLIILWVIAMFLSPVSLQAAVDNAFLMEPPPFGLPLLSDDGTQVIYTRYQEGINQLICRQVVSGEETVVSNKDRERGIYRYWWLKEKICYVTYYLPTRTQRIQIVSVTGELLDVVTPFMSGGFQVFQLSRVKPHKLAVLHQMPHSPYPNLQLITLPTGEVELLTNNNGEFRNFLIDRDFAYNTRLAPRADGSLDIYYQQSSNQWEEAYSWHPDDVLFSGPLFFDETGQILYLKDCTDVVQPRLVRVDLPTRNREVVAEIPGHAFHSVLVDPVTAEPMMVFFDDTEQVVFTQGECKTDFGRLWELTGEFPVVIDTSLDKTHWLLRVKGGANPAAYKVFERKTGELYSLFTEYSVPEKFQGLASEKIQITASDSTILQGYLTFPSKVEKKNLPTILLIHGGPWQRVIDDFRPFTQWLAGLGFLVAEVNYRGSTDQGKHFLKAGDGQFDGGMLHDVRDIHMWLLNRAYSDKKQIWLFGQEFGGFLALQLASLYPTDYAGLITWCAPVDLRTWIEQLPVGTKQRSMEKRRHGDPSQNPERFVAVAPATIIDKIRCPWITVYGSRNPRIIAGQTSYLIKEQQKKKRPVVEVVFEEEGAEIQNVDNRNQAINQIERFIEDNRVK